MELGGELGSTLGPIGTIVGAVAGGIIAVVIVKKAGDYISEMGRRDDVEHDDDEGERSRKRDKGRDRSRQSKPNNCPPGTKPINETPWSKWHQPIKEGVGNGPDDWTGISPNGDVISTGPNGEAINNGPATDYIPK
jgi:hypothetical protein